MKIFTLKNAIKFTFTNKLKVVTMVAVFISVSIFCKATNYYVSSSSGNDNNNGLSWSTAWKTMAKVNSKTFAAGDTIRFYGTITDANLTKGGTGTQAHPIVFMGTGPNSGRAVISRIYLASSSYVNFLNFEASGSGSVYGLVYTTTSAVVNHIRFENLYLHNAVDGVNISSPNTTDLTFVNTTIYQMNQDGIVLNDNAGDRFSYIGGSITNTGNVPPGWGTHGIYASGGTGHVFDGITFGNNSNGWSLSLRRGGVIVRNCTFINPTGSGAINNNNEDEGTTNPYTGSPSHGLTYSIYRNYFDMDGLTAIYQSTNNDNGINDPNNTWAVFNNTFVSSTLNFGGSGLSEYYNIYIRNNAFVDCSVVVESPNSGKVHLLSNNGWWNSGTPQGSSNITTDPLLDAQNNVTSSGYIDQGSIVITPSLSMIASTSDPLGYCDSAPDIGKNESCSGVVIPDLIGYWRFEEQSGTTAVDSSTCSNNGTINGPVYTTTGVNGRDLTFDGVDDYIEVPSSTTINGISNAITIMGWIKLTQLGVRNNILERWLYGTGINKRSYNLYVETNGKIVFGLSSDGTSTNAKWLTSSDSITVGVWTHIAVTSDGTTMKIYINGVLDANTLTAPSGIYASTENVHIGNWEYSSGSWANPLKGQMDDIKLYRIALTFQQIQQAILPASAGTIAGSTNVCQGQTVTYTTPVITNATSYTWTLPAGATGTSTTNSITVNFGTSAGSGNITVKGQNSCGDGASSSFPVTINPIPVTPTITQMQNTLTSSTSIGNQWYDANGIINGATSQTYTATVDGYYYVIVTENGCSSEASTSIHVIVSNIGINDHDSLQIYPNPVKNELNIRLNNISEQIEITIINSVGQTVYKTSIQDNGIINTEFLNRGVYFIKIKSSEKILYKKMTKE